MARRGLGVRWWETYRGRRPTVNAEGSAWAAKHFERSEMKSYEELAAKSCKYCGGAVMIWRNDLEAWFCVNCGEARKLPPPEKPKKQEEGKQ